MAKAPPSEPETAPKKKPAARELASAAELQTRADRLVAIVNEHPDGIGPRDLIARARITKPKFQHVRHLVVEDVDQEGSRASLRFFPKGTDRPERAAALSRAPQLPVDVPTTREQKASVAQGELRRRIRDAILDGLQDGPVGAARLKEAILADHASADDGDFDAARRRLASERRIEISANKLQLTGVQDNTKPITKLEQEVVDAVGTGRTAQEIAINCELLKGNAFTATRVLTALSHRGIVRRRPGQLPGERAIYELPEEATA